MSVAEAFVNCLIPPRNLILVCILLCASHSPAAAAEITGTVLNAEGAEPLSKIEVTISGTAYTAETSSDGKFRFADLAPGNYTLQLRGLGYRTLSEPFTITSASNIKDFILYLAPDSFRRKEEITVHGDVFDPAAWPAVGDMNLTTSEIQQTSTVLVNDPYRSLQSLPGVSASANNDFLAQFSVMGAPYEQVGVYVDDVLVPNLLHTLPGVYDQPSLSLLTGNDIEELHLMPVAFPVRYADDNGAALTLTTRSGSAGPPRFHVALGLADGEFLGEGGFGGSHHGTWFFSARKSYVGYLEHFFNSISFSNIALYDANVKFTYDLTPSHTFSLFATGGQTHVSDPSLPSSTDASVLKSASNDLAVARFGWRWQMSSRMLLDTRVAYVRSGLEQDNASAALLESSLEREWSTGTTFSWNWSEGGILQAGYAIRWPNENDQSNVFATPGQPPIYAADHFTFHSQDAFVQVSQQFWSDRLSLQGGLRWAQESSVRVRPLTPQASLFFRVLRNTQLQAGWGRYDQFADVGASSLCGTYVVQVICFSPLPYASSQYLFAVEQRLGARSRLRVEAFDRQNVQRDDFYSQNPTALLAKSLLTARDYSRGLQFLLQRRSENRLSGWLGYTFVLAQGKNFAITLPQGSLPIQVETPYYPTLVDQRHSINLVASYRLTPTIRIGLKNVYGSGYPALNYTPAALRLGPYERLDLRADKSWLFAHWKLSLYAELLNITKHYNPVFLSVKQAPSGIITLIIAPGVPITPTVGLTFDF
jgi:hypothetical protein